MTTNSASQFEPTSQMVNQANIRLINSFPDRDTTLIQKTVNRTDRLKSTKTMRGFLVYCQGYSEPFIGRDPHRAVDKLMKSARITRVQEYINRKGEL